MTRQKCADTWCAILWARVSNFLSHRIVKSSTFMIYSKLTFQCTRMAFKTIRFVQGLSRTPLLFFLDISPPDFPNIFYEKTNSRKSKIWKSQNPGSLTSAQQTSEFPVSQINIFTKWHHTAPFSFFRKDESRLLSGACLFAISRCS